MAEYVEHLEEKLQDVDKGITRAKARFESSEAADKVKALSELTALRLRHQELSKRIADAKENHSENWSALYTSFREELDGLKDTVERWLGRSA